MTGLLFFLFSSVNNLVKSSAECTVKALHYTDASCKLVPKDFQKRSIVSTDRCQTEE
jgi:hypothetical protein